MSSDPEAVRVRDWRHKLQRAFLSKSVPSAEVNIGHLFAAICRAAEEQRELILLVWLCPLPGNGHLRQAVHYH